MIHRSNRLFIFLSVLALFLLLLRQQIHQVQLFQFEVTKNDSAVSTTKRHQPSTDCDEDDDDDDDYYYASTCYLKEMAQRIRHVFVPKPISTWCHRRGIVLIKVPKSASSTVAGVTLRIEQQHSCNESDWEHALAREKWNDKQKNDAFWLTMIREPSARALSAVYFYKVSFLRTRTRPKDNNNSQNKSIFFPNPNSAKSAPQNNMYPSNPSTQQVNEHKPVSDALVLRELKARFQKHRCVLICRRRCSSKATATL